MVDLSAALGSGSLSVLVGTAIALGFLHTVLGPDHYIPFVMMARAQHWSLLKTAAVSGLCGVGHVGSSVVIGLLLAVTGMAFTEWHGSRWAGWHEARGSIAAWLLIGVGAAFLLWGVHSALRGRKHTHSHLHEDSATHAHEHDHSAQHMHVHDKSLTPWVLFTIFVLGPCESLIPLMLAAWALTGMAGTLLVASVFSVVTILTILGIVSALMLGLSRINLGKLERWSTALAGLSLGLCGVAIQWLGL